MLPHKNDLSAALTRDDQHCPFLANEFSDVGGDATDRHSTLIDYEDRQFSGTNYARQTFVWASSDWWAGSYAGWYVHVCVYVHNGKWHISVSGNDDTGSCLSFDSYEDARTMVQRFPLILTKDWLLFNGFEMW